MARRTGATLVEVLVAIFVMGIGLLAVLALFPLGVIRMAQAIQDNRTGNIALNADAIAAIKIRNDPTFLVTLRDTCKNPGGALPPAISGPSYPVFIDPIGFYNGATTPYQNWLAGGPVVAPPGQEKTIRRVSLPFVDNAGANREKVALRWLSFLDDLIFDTNGFPKYLPPQFPPLGQPPFFQRDPRYSWGYMCQMPNVTDPSLINLAVVVFNRRTMGMAGNNPLSEDYYDSLFDTTKNVVTLTVNGNSVGPPLIRLGDWIFDCTGTHGYFYRVVSITDIGINANPFGPPAQQFEIEVQTPFRGFIGTNIPQTAPNSGIYVGQTMVLESVVEVFERGTGRLP